MLENINKIAWPFAILLIVFVCIQATLFLIHALKFNAKHKLYSKGEVLDIARTTCVTTIGPSFSAIIVVLALIPILGSAVTFMRCGVIGAADYELLNANIAVEAIGIPFGSPDFTEAVFTVAMFGMVTASAPWLIHLIFSCKALDRAVIRASKGKRSFIPALGMAAELGFISYWALNTGSASTENTVGIISSLVTALIFGVICRKSKNKKLKSWTVGIAMIGGMIGATIMNGILTA